MDWGFFAAAAGIALVDLVLSGDNALVIGAAASKLPRAQRLMAIIWGGAGAIVFRIVLAAAATLLLRIPLLQAIGGIVLLAIAIRLFLPESEQRKNGKAPNTMLSAIVTILVADATMSLDNVLAVGALARGRVELLVAGLLVSMILLFVASALVARLIEALPFLLDVAALVLGWTAANLIAADGVVAPKLGVTDDLTDPRTLSLHLVCLVIVLLADVIIRFIVRQRDNHPTVTPPTDAEVEPARAEAD